MYLKAAHLAISDQSVYAKYIEHGDQLYDASARERIDIVRAAREAWEKEGFHGVTYINTFYNEAHGLGERDRTCHIIFSPRHVKIKKITRVM